MVEEAMPSPAPYCAHELVGWLEEEPCEKVTPPQHPPTPTTSFATYILEWIGVKDEKRWGFWVGWGVGGGRAAQASSVHASGCFLDTSVAPTHRSSASDDETRQVDAVRIPHFQNSPLITAGRLRVDCALDVHIRALQRAARVSEDEPPRRATPGLRQHARARLPQRNGAGRRRVNRRPHPARGDDTPSPCFDR
jgi:hypothetical protein